MCGRYVLKRKDLEALMQQLGIKDPREYASRYNIAPTTHIPAIRPAQSGPGREAAALQWGLVPWWSKTAKDGARLSNARAEGIASKPAFREAFRKRRCVVPASGFYEWQTLGRVKHPWYFHLQDEAPFYLAGIWESWRSEDGVEIQTCALITTTPNTVVAALHDRMPVILTEAALEPWLDPELNDPTRLEPLLATFPAERMRSRPVSPKVNRVGEDGPSCLDPVEPPRLVETPQLSLGLE